MTKTSVSVSVRKLVEFLLRSGDIDNTAGGKSSEEAMQAGSRIHKKLQKAAGAEYEAEVRMSVTVPFEKFDLVIDGRADGVIKTKSGIVIDEIKGTYRNLDSISGPDKVHLSQAMCYAYIVLTKGELPEIGVQVTYCNLETEAVRRFKQILSKEEITEWFTALVKEYGKWAELEIEWNRIRNESIGSMTFPFEYREGQKKLIKECKKAYESEKFLFLEAPTGCGKTITTLYPAIEALGDGVAARIFYLTAKTITRTVAADTLNLLRKNALKIKSIVLTAKEKICILKEPDCNPKACERARGHYDRINEALFDCITSNEELSREKIEEYALKHMVCPFEFSLDLSLFADVIICDYNYVYDPHVYLRRFFEGGVAGRYLFLTDEAHNLVDRAREMYSATLCKEDMQLLAARIKDETEGKKNPPIPARYADRFVKALEECASSFLKVKRKCDEGYFVYENYEEFSPQLQALSRFTSAIRKYLEEEEKRKNTPLKKAVLDFFFDVCHFQEMWELKEDEYTLYASITEEEKFMVRLLCKDPGRLLKECNKRAVAGVFFSATLFPMQYYKDLLGGDEKDKEILAKSIFPKENRKILVAKDVTSRYEDRTEANDEAVAGYIYRMVKAKYGNYMVFFPSFEFEDRIYHVLNRKYAPVVFDIVMQKEGMSEYEREAFLAKFRTGEKKEEETQFSLLLPDLSGKKKTLPPLKKGLSAFKKSVVGFCVLGGIFAEGIDLTKDDLIGAVIVGGGVPFVTKDREFISEYFDDDGGKGYEYAYRIPGMNKVLQAAGRVIRTVDDKGIILYLEKRFLKPEYEILFPKHMKPDETVNLNTVARHLSAFWAKEEE